MKEYLRINHNSEIPKYKQVVDLIVSDIEAGIFKQGQRIPSINETSEDLLLSRDTVEKAYVSLRKKGILSSVRGKGYYVNQVDVCKQLKVALVFNKLSNYKRNIYYSFIETLGNKAATDVFIYNYDLQQFKSIVENHASLYDYFVILPHFKDENADVASVIRTIPRKKVMLVDRNLESLKDYPIVYQEYEKDIQSALSEGIDFIRKYNSIHLIFPADQYYPVYIKRGFQIFCQVHGLEFSIIDQLCRKDVEKGRAYVIISDDDLYRFIKICRAENWVPGKDVGIVSYNENPVKEILEDGITTISTNHDEIGRIAAQMILTKDFRRIKSPFQFIKRNSL
ncbi:transcriptional regulator, GntR family [Mariniphaga anaerophila]|uniref:Transcriptional regulator, GntR family n=1 Tax=Mariniphaga anaerophila TaxID=1484053 RepID=A0A1M5G605_9BACT|nr:GntR family transcriptional regulator [Mariniphaga anaerophila]SHF99217.1 transcriptional regulator, GntR family [Mariniphaga anaerophila]